MPRRRLLILFTILAVISAFALLRRSIGLEFQPDSMRAVVEGLGIWAPLVFVGIVAFRIPLGVPSAVVLIGGGLVFGATMGTLYGAIGLVLSALVLFSTARWAGRPAVEGRLPERLRYLLEVAGSRGGAVFIALGSAYPMSPITSYHVLAGVTGMAFLTFALAATVGCILRAAIYTFFGSSLLEADPLQMLTAGGLLLASLLVPLAFATPRAWLLGALGSRRVPERDGLG